MHFGMKQNTLSLIAPVFEVITYEDGGATTLGEVYKYINFMLDDIRTVEREDPTLAFNN